MSEHSYGALHEHGYGWLPSLPDLRQYQADTESGTPMPILDEVDPRDGMPDCYDQGYLGSCVANAVAAALEYNDILDGEHVGTPSRLFIYYEARRRIDTVHYDSGSYGHDGFKCLRKEGAPPETAWPYDIGRFREKPPVEVYELARENRIGTYTHPGLSFIPIARRQQSFKKILSNRQTIAFGFSVYESFESLEVERTGVIPMPGPGESILGGHEVLLVGYIEHEGKEYALVRNSWGTEWGLNGYCLMPWEFVLSREISDDYRTIYRPVGE